MRYYKVLNKSKTHHGFKYDCNGLNVDVHPFDRSKTCGKGGLYFTARIGIGNWISFVKDAEYVCDVEIPEGEEVVMVRAGKLKTHSIILSNCRNIWKTPELIEELEGYKKRLKSINVTLN